MEGLGVAVVMELAVRLTWAAGVVLTRITGILRKSVQSWTKQKGNSNVSH
jgi:hypothetical protein